MQYDSTLNAPLVFTFLELSDVKYSLWPWTFCFKKDMNVSPKPDRFPQSAPQHN